MGRANSRDARALDTRLLTYAARPAKAPSPPPSCSRAASRPRHVRVAECDPSASLRKGACETGAGGLLVRLPSCAGRLQQPRHLLQAAVAQRPAPDPRPQPSVTPLLPCRGRLCDGRRRSTGAPAILRGPPCDSPVNFCRLLSRSPPPPTRAV